MGAVSTYRVPGMTCDHCTRAVRAALAEVPGVEAVEVDLGTKVVTVHGDELSDAALRAAIEDAGYDVQ